MKVGYSNTTDNETKWVLTHTADGCSGQLIYAADDVEEISAEGGPAAKLAPYTYLLADWSLFYMMHGKPFNRLVETLLEKRTDKVRLPGEPIKNAYILVGDVNDQNTWELHLTNGTTPEGVSIVPELNGFDAVHHYANGVYEHFDEFVPEITMVADPVSVSAGGFTTVTLTLEHGHDTTVYLEAVSGYLPQTRVTTSGLTATFKVGALGMEAGEEIRIKAGFKYFTGRGDIVIPVTA
jgi:hypothetical protein